MSNFWENESVILELDKNDRGEKIIVKSCTKNGKDFIDIRTSYLKNGVPTPGKGIAIPADLSDEIANNIIEYNSKK